MKMKSIVLSLLAIVLSSTFTMATEPGNPKVVVVNQKESGVFKIIYEGGKAGKVSMKIYDQIGKLVFAETINSVNGFSRPLNFGGMNPGEYTIEIADENGKNVQKIAYRTESVVKDVHIAKIANDDKYLVALASKGEEEINVRIFDGANQLVHDQSVKVKGDYGVVYNLKGVKGSPTIEVTDKMGNVKTIKY